MSVIFNILRAKSFFDLKFQNQKTHKFKKSIDSVTGNEYTSCHSQSRFNKSLTKII